MPKGVYQRQPWMDLGKKPSITPKQDAMIARLYLKGFAVKAITLKTGLGKKTIWNSLKRTKTPIRPRANYGPKNGCWHGGRRIDDDGYVLILRPDHPDARKSGYILEHRFVMEQAIGRRLGRREVVHHKNRNKQDNRLSNLMLFSSNGIHLAHELTGKVPKWRKPPSEWKRPSAKKNRR